MQDLKPSLSAEDASDDKTQQDRGQVSHSASSEIEAVQDSVKPMEVVPQEYVTFVILSHIVPCPCCALCRPSCTFASVIFLCFSSLCSTNLTGHFAEPTPSKMV